MRPPLIVDRRKREAPSMTWPCGCKITFKRDEGHAVVISDAFSIPCPLHGLPR